MITTTVKSRKEKGHTMAVQAKVDGQSRPHAGKNSVKSALIHYPAMQEAIEKIADPVTFEALKAFYNIS